MDVTGIRIEMPADVLREPVHGVVAWLDGKLEEIPLPRMELGRLNWMKEYSNGCTPSIAGVEREALSQAMAMSGGCCGDGGGI